MFSTYFVLTTVLDLGFISELNKFHYKKLITLKVFMRKGSQIMTSVSTLRN